MSTSSGQEALEAENAVLRQRLDELEARVAVLGEGMGGEALVSQGSSSSLAPTWLFLGGGLAVAVVGVAMVQRRIWGRQG